MGALPPIDVVEAAGLACVRGGRPVFCDVSFRLPRGAALVVEGANGSGKTSLLRLIAGLLTPAGGTVSFSSAGERLEDGEARGKCVGWLGHHDAAKPQLTATESLRFFAQLYGAAGGTIAALLERVGLSRAAGLPCQYLSAGHKRRLALARLKLCGRPLWLLDEPLSPLDAAWRERFSALMAAHLAGGGLILAAVHDPLPIPAKALELTAPEVAA